MNLDLLKISWEGAKKELPQAEEEGGEGGGGVAAQGVHRPHPRHQAQEQAPPQQEVVPHSLRALV